MPGYIPALQEPLWQTSRLVSPPPAHSNRPAVAQLEKRATRNGDAQIMANSTSLDLSGCWDSNEGGQCGTWLGVFLVHWAFSFLFYLTCVGIDGNLRVCPAFNKEAAKGDRFVDSASYPLQPQTQTMQLYNSGGFHTS